MEIKGLYILWNVIQNEQVWGTLAHVVFEITSKKQETKQIKTQPNIMITSDTMGESCDYHMSV